MRISCDPDDPSYSSAFSHCTIYLEGAARNNVVTADEDRRFAVTFRRDEFGAPMLAKDKSQLRDKFYGAVRVDCPAWLRSEMEDPSGDNAIAAAAAVLQARLRLP